MATTKTAVSPSSQPVVRVVKWRRFAAGLAIASMTWLSGCGGSPTSPTPPPPPALSLACPAAVDVQSPDDGPVRVAYSAPVAQGGTPPVTVSCSPPTDTNFPLGVTPVNCTATDARAVTATCSFTVTVRPRPRLTATNFLAFGDSITYGVLSPPIAKLSVGPPHSYPAKLLDLIADRYQVQTFTLVNSGLPGELASGTGKTRLVSELNARRPQVLLLMEGSNDLLAYLEEGVRIGGAALEQMVRDAQSRGVTVFLATIPPQRLGGARDRVARIVPDFNVEVRAIAARTGAVLVDVYTAILPNIDTLIGVDDLHPTEKGFEVIAQTFFEAIRTNLESTALPSPAHVR